MKNPAVSVETKALVGSLVGVTVGAGDGLDGAGVGFADGAGKTHDPPWEHDEPGYCCMQSMSLKHCLQ